MAIDLVAEIKKRGASAWNPASWLPFAEQKQAELEKEYEQQTGKPISRERKEYFKFKTHYEALSALGHPKAEAYNPDTSPMIIQLRGVASQEDAADTYSKQVPDLINQEVGQARSQLATQLAQGRRSLKGAENARGMLFSGRRIKGEGDLAADAAGQLAQVRGETIRKVLGQEQELHAKPVAARLGVSAAEAEQRGALEQMKQGLQSQRQGYLNQGIGTAAYGAGSLYGGKKPQPTQDGSSLSGPGGGGSSGPMYARP